MTPSSGLLPCLALVIATSTIEAQPPVIPNKVERPTVTVLTGLTVPEFEREMQHFVQAIGVSCSGCHLPRGNFASDENPRKVKARQMIAIDQGSQQGVFPRSQDH